MTKDLEQRILAIALNRKEQMEKLVTLPLLFRDQDVISLYSVAKKIYLTYEDLSNKTYREYFLQNNISDTYYKKISAEHSVSDAFFDQYLHEIIDKTRRESCQKILAMANISNFSIEEIIEAFDNDVINAVKISGKTIFHVSDVLKELGAKITAKEVDKIDIGINWFNRNEGGNRKREVMYICARPSTGKTATAINLIKQMLENGLSVMMFSAEIERQMVMQKMVCSFTKIQEKAVELKTMTNEMRTMYSAGMEKFYKYPFYIDDTPNIYYKELLRRSRYAIRKYGINVIVIDHLHILTHDNERLSEVLQLKDMTSSLKQLARQNDILVICLAQMNRNIESRKDGDLPMMQDIRGSGSVEENSDIIIFIIEEAETGVDECKLKYYVRKNRNGMKEFCYYADFQKDICRINQY